MSAIETDDKVRLRKLAEAATIGGVHIYREDGGIAIHYRNRGAQLCLSEGVTLDAAIDAMDLDV